MLLVLRRVLGVIALLVGLFALVTPLTPGSWLMFIGLELLGIGFLIPQRVRNKLPARLRFEKKEGSELPSRPEHD